MMSFLSGRFLAIGASGHLESGSIWSSAFFTEQCSSCCYTSALILILIEILLSTRFLFWS